MTKPLVRHPVVLTPLSPIHIGSGEDLDWTRAVPDPSRPELMLFDPLAVRLPANEAEKLAKLSTLDGAEAIIRLQQLLSANVAHLGRAESGRIGLTDQEHKRLKASFGRNTQAAQRGAGQVANQIAIARHALDPAGRPYVPGSSLKGALRTAEVARRDAVENRGSHHAPREDKSDPSDRLLGKFAASPFARLFVSDLLPSGDWRGLIAEVRNERRLPKEHMGPKGVPVRVELIRPFLPGALAGDIREHLARGAPDAGRQFLPLTDLLKTTHGFHAQLFAFFEGELQKANRNLLPGWLQGVRGLLAAEEVATAIGEGRAALVRLGKFGSAESKTVAWRAVRIPQAANKGGQEWVLHPYTLWLADLGAHRLPLGWALLEVAEEASAPVREFCARFREANAEDEEQEDRSPPVAPPPPPSDRIVTDRSGMNRSRLGSLEDQHDGGQTVFEMLKNLANQAKAWPDADRKLFAQLYHEKLRHRLRPDQQRLIDPRLPRPA
ncbi:MAG: RAMP superfamily CRISPR-associated protein [Sphingomonadaceae bacterium]